MSAHLNHVDMIFGAGQCHVQLAALHLADQRVQHKLAVDISHTHCPHGRFKGDIRDHQSGRGSDNREDIDVVFLVRRKRRNDDLHIVTISGGEEGP